MRARVHFARTPRGVDGRGAPSTIFSWTRCSRYVEPSSATARFGSTWCRVAGRHAFSRIGRSARADACSYAPAAEARGFDLCVASCAVGAHAPATQNHHQHHHCRACASDATPKARRHDADRRSSYRRHAPAAAHRGRSGCGARHFAQPRVRADIATQGARADRCIRAAAAVRPGRVHC